MTAPFEVLGGTRASEPSHLSEEQLAQLRTLLAQQVLAQHEALTDQDEALTDATGDVVAAAVTSERELAHAFVQFTREAVDELDAAIARIDNGQYGVCDGCGEPIAFERLEAVPETVFCVSCPRSRGMFS